MTRSYDATSPVLPQGPAIRGRLSLPSGRGETDDRSMTRAPLVRVRIANRALRDVIIEQIAAMGWSVAVDEASMVVTTTTDCSVDECRVLARDGSRVVVLASAANAGMAERYLSGGASAYLPMRVDVNELAVMLRAAAAM